MPFPSEGDLPDPGIKLGSFTLQADSLASEPLGKLVLREAPIKKKKKNSLEITVVSTRVSAYY